MDSSVYDAMVRMAQDFKMGTPLIDGQGNFGSIDGDSSAAMRYCVTGDTLINTNKGLIRIDEIVKNSELSSETDIDLKILSFAGRQNKAVKFFNSGYHETIKITTDTGRIIRGSYNHPILILKENKYKWIILKNISIGDMAIIDKNTTIFSDMYEEEYERTYAFEKIIGIEHLEKEIVYSIRVDSNCHSFVANGFINHNTECKMTPIATELLKELNKEIVDYIPNFDDTELEPTILPSILPNLFLNGTEGIAVGFRTEIPPHNLMELTEAIISYIKNPKITVEEILSILPAPDYPTGGIIVNKNQMIDLYSTGEGTVSIRSKIKIEEGAYGKTNLIVTEIPYTQSGRKQSLIDDIADLVKDKKIDAISDIRDESKGEDVRIVIEIKKGFDPEDVKHILFKKSKLQDNQSCNFLVIDNNQPKTVSIKEYFKLYLQFQEEIMTKKYNILLNKALMSKEKIDGLLKAIDYIDVIIEILRGAKNRDAVKQCFKKGDTTNISFKTKKYEKVAKTFNFTELQCSSILDMKLERLINLEADKLLSDKTKLEKDITSYANILSSKKNLYKIIIKNLKDIQKEYGVKRKTKIIDSEIKIIEEKIVEEDLQILIDRFGYVKTVDLVSMQRSSDETITQFKHTLVAKNTDKLCIFTKSGQLHSIKVMDIPKVKIKDKGVPLDVISKLDKNDDILLITSFENLRNKNVLFVLNNGFVRFVPSSEFDTNRQSIVATKLEDEELLYISAISKEESLIIKTNKKKHKIDLVEMPLHKKTVKGKRVISFKKGEKIEELIVSEMNGVAV